MSVGRDSHGSSDPFPRQTGSRGAFEIGNRRGRTIRTALALAACVSGAAACVDGEPRTKPMGNMMGAGGKGGTGTCQAMPVPFTGNAPIPSQQPPSDGPYLWRNAVIKGGGFVSGIIMSPVLAGLAFARTDVGGAYRSDPTNKRWMPITDWIGREDSNLTGIESIAADPVDPRRVYLAAGTYLTAGNGWILSSTDMGVTWTKNAIAAPMGGNADGRSMGERLAIDPNLPSTLYFGSRTTGLWKSTDSARTWALVSNFPTTGSNNGGGMGFGLTFVVFDRSSASPGSATGTIYVGVGVTTESALYRSVDAGATWEPVSGQPTGMMPHHAVPDGCGNLYLAYNGGPAPRFGAGPNDIMTGAIWRHRMNSAEWQDVSPSPEGAPMTRLPGGFGGISVDPSRPGTLLVSTMDFWSPGEIFRSTDSGKTWAQLVKRAQWDVAGATWLWWHTNRLPAMGWMGDIEIDPFNPSRALFITGQGLWSTNDLTASDMGKPTNWAFDNDGLEETVALDLVSPPAGAPLLSAVGDIAGFRHDDLDVSPPNGMFSNPIFGNTSSLDFAEAAPEIVARVGTLSSVTGPRAGGAYSMDGGTTWRPFAATPPVPMATGGVGMSAAVASSGSIAVSADGVTSVWAPQSSRTVAVMPAYSRDKGATWTACAGLPAGSRVASDRVNPSKFYASGGNRLYVSTDGGATFVAVTAPSAGRPRPVFGVEGHVWATTNTGLIRSQDSGASWSVIPKVTGATAVGFGMAAPGKTYPAVYLAGAMEEVWGVYRSDDAGTTWQRVDDPQHRFGSINCLSGDPRVYGRVYLGTGGRGIIYGDPS